MKPLTEDQYIVFYSEEDQAYIAKMIVWPYFRCHGATEQEAIDNLVEADQMAQDLLTVEF